MMIDIIVHKVECECIGVHGKIQKLVKVTGVIFGESDIVIVIFVLTVLFITVLNAVVITPIAARCSNSAPPPFLRLWDWTQVPLASF